MASKEQCDLLLADRSTLSVQKALSLMWERRSEKNVVAEVIDIIWYAIFSHYICIHFQILGFQTLLITF